MVNGVLTLRETGGSCCIIPAPASRASDRKQKRQSGDVGLIPVETATGTKVTYGWWTLLGETMLTSLDPLPLRSGQACRNGFFRVPGPGATSPAPRRARQPAAEPRGRQREGEAPGETRQEPAGDRGQSLGQDDGGAAGELQRRSGSAAEALGQARHALEVAGRAGDRKSLVERTRARGRGDPDGVSTHRRQRCELGGSDGRRRGVARR